LRRSDLTVAGKTLRRGQTRGCPQRYRRVAQPLRRNIFDDREAGQREGVERLEE
jgi:hypothetical protein